MLTRKELANELKCTERTIDNMMKKGIPHYKIDKIVRFKLDEVLAWMKKGNQ